MGREFAHVHPASDGSLHMVLSERDREHVLDRGWGELHPWAKSGKICPNVVMVYAPRDDAEIDVVLAITRAAKRNALIQTASDQPTCTCTQPGEDP